MIDFVIRILILTNNYIFIGYNKIGLHVQTYIAIRSEVLIIPNMVIMLHSNR
jgi:hypothetical protein